jgi:hypothetical protein
VIYGWSWGDLLVIFGLVLFVSLVIAIIWNFVAIGLEELMKAWRRRHRRRH